MTPDYELQKIQGYYSERIRHNHIISKILIIANVLFLLAVILVLCASCEPEIDPTRHFIINEGDHYSSPKLSESLQSKKLAFDARFNETAMYVLSDKGDQTDLNKLMGFCDCNSLPHENSARFAWVWNNNQLEIHAYTYRNEIRITQFIGVVSINSYNHYEIELASDHYVFRLNNLPAIIMKRGTTCSTGFYFKLWPYFGGELPAPHQVVVDIKPTY